MSHRSPVASQGQFPSAFTDAARHPHMLFTAEEVPALRDRIRRGQRSHRHLATAERWCKDFLNPLHPQHFDFRERRSAIWHGREGNFVIPARLLTLALTGWLADQRPWLDAAREALLTMIRERVADALGEFTTWRTMQHDAGKYYAMLGLLYDLLAPTFSHEECTQVIAHARETFALADQHWYANLRDVGNNRGGKWFVGLGIMAMAFREVPELPLNKPGYALMGPRMLETSLRQTIGRDGAPFEGISYGASHAQFLAVAADIFARCGLRDCRQDRRFSGFAQYLVHETIDHTALPNPLNDCLPQLAPALLFRQAMRGRDGVCLWQWDRFVEDVSAPWSPLRPDGHPRDFADVPWHLLWPDDEAPLPIAPAAGGWPSARHFRERGVVSIRSGWGPDDLHVTFFSGPPSATGHWQGDQNQVTFHARGESFLIDSGYTLPDAAGIEQRAGRAEAHNIVMVDGKGPIDKQENVGWPMGRIACFHTHDNVTYARGDASEAYRHPMMRADRHLHLVARQGFPRHMLWLDDLEADGQTHEFALLLHTAAGNRIELRTADQVVLYGARNALSIHIASNSPFQLTQDLCGGHPRLRIQLQAQRCRLCLALTPDAAPQSLTMRFNDTHVEARLAFPDTVVLHCLPCVVSTGCDEAAPVASVRLE